MTATGGGAEPYEAAGAGLRRGLRASPRPARPRLAIRPPPRAVKLIPHGGDVEEAERIRETFATVTDPEAGR